MEKKNEWEVVKREGKYTYKNTQTGEYAGKYFVYASPLSEGWGTVSVRDKVFYFNPETKESAKYKDMFGFKRSFNSACDIHEGWGVVKFNLGLSYYFNVSTCQCVGHGFLAAFGVCDGIAQVELTDRSWTYFVPSKGMLFDFRGDRKIPSTPNWEEVLTQSPSDFKFLPTKFFSEENKLRLEKLLDCVRNGLEKNIPENATEEKMLSYKKYVQDVKTMAMDKIITEKLNIIKEEELATEAQRNQEAAQRTKREVLDSINSIRDTKFDEGKSGK